MNVEIGAEAGLFPEKEYISGIFVAVQQEGSGIFVAVQQEGGTHVIYGSMKGGTQIQQHERWPHLQRQLKEWDSNSGT
jgi:hypothetical protein